MNNETNRLRLQKLETDLKRASNENGLNISGIRRISAQCGEGVEKLLDATWVHIPEGPAYFPADGSLSDKPVRFFVAEYIRKQLFLLLGEELPYSCAVEITMFDEQVKITRIEAIIHVERPSQKGIVIGEGGKKIKEIGQSARKEIEVFLKQKIFLGLQVKVYKNWTRNKEMLKKLGFILPPESNRG